jgi:hypothetical protein
MFLCIRSSVSKLKNHSDFYTPKNNVLTCIFYFNNLFIEVKRTLAKISKTNFFFILCCFSIRDYEFIRKMYSRY